MRGIKFNCQTLFRITSLKSSYCLVLLAIMLLIDFLTQHSEWDQAVAYQRATRMLNGQIPFKNFYLLYLPLSVYLNSLALHIYDSFLTIKLIGFTICLYILFTTYLITQRLTASRTASLVTAILTYFFALKAWPESNYSWYSIAAIITMLFMILQDYDLSAKQFRLHSRHWLYAGIFLGISFCLKHNFAIIVYVAISVFLIIDVLLMKGSKRKSVIYAFIGLSLGLVGPIILMAIYLISNHALIDAYKDIVLGSGSYIEFMKFPYLSILSSNPTLMTQSTLKIVLSFLENISKIPVVLGAPLVGLFIIIYSYLNRDVLHRQLLIFLGLICSASFLFLFPRADYPHLAFTLPILFIGTVISFLMSQPQSKWKQMILNLLGIYLLVISLTITFEKVVNVFQGNLKYMPISASFVTQGVAQDIESSLNSISQIQARGKKAIILDPSLSLYYPFLKISNPIRYDFPTKGNFGINNGSDVIKYIKSTSNICLFVSRTTTQEKFYPSQIVNAVQLFFRSKNSIGKWDIYCK